MSNKSVNYDHAAVIRFTECPTWRICRDERLLLAVSGGADSVALLRLVLAADPPRDRLAVGHFDHCLRADSSADADFTRQLCESSQIPCLVGKPAAAPTARDENTARQARYDWLAQTAGNIGARYLLTAHTADDQVETILHRFLRGTGRRGLIGMRVARPISPALTLLRPLLGFRRQDLRDYLSAIGQTWREDPTNTATDYTRNRIRLDLLPRLRAEYNPRVDEALLRLAEQIALWEAPLQTLLDEQLATAVRIDPHGAGFAINGQVITTWPDSLLTEVLLTAWERGGLPLGEMTAEHWQTLTGLVRELTRDQAGHIAATEASSARRTDFPGSVRITKTADGVELRRPG